MRKIITELPPAPYPLHPTSGFTLLEVLASLAVVVILSLLATGAFNSLEKREALSKQSAIIVSLLGQARSLTVASKQASSYGIHFQVDKVVLFKGNTYIDGDTSNTVEPLHGAVQISSITLAGNGSDVIFDRLFGKTNQSGAITLSLASDPSQTKVITIFPSGIAESN